jgi:hypothetical protein
LKSFVLTYLAIIVALFPALGYGKDAKVYRHASEFQVATLDQTLRVQTGNDVTLGKTRTDAKLDGGSQGIHLLYTDQGDFRVEAPVNKGLSIVSALGTGLSNANRPAWAQQSATTFHNRWFLDNVQPGTKVLFASTCSSPSKRHPNETVRCEFWFPDPDSNDHEYQTSGDFTAYVADGGSNLQKTANVLCGTGKLKPETEAQVCSGTISNHPADSQPISTQPASVSEVRQMSITEVQKKYPNLNEDQARDVIKNQGAVPVQ